MAERFETDECRPCYFGSEYEIRQILVLLFVLPLFEAHF